MANCFVIMESVVYFTLLFASATTSMDCNCHQKYCFTILSLPSTINGSSDLENACANINNNSWPLEIYDKSVQDGVNKYLESLDSQYSLGNIYLNVDRLKSGWQYAMDKIYTTDDFKEFQITHHEDAVYLDTYTNKFETGWVKYFDLPYICSYNVSSPKCNTTHSFDLRDQCFTAHKTPKSWINAQNDCATMGGYLAVVKSHHKNRLLGWLGETINHWWIGIIWRPLKWHKKGTLVTWTNFQPSLKFMEMPDFIYFQINSDDNKWKISDNMNGTNYVVCMKENSPVPCKGECFSDASTKELSKVQTVTIITVVIIIVTMTTLIIVFLVKKRRTRSRHSPTSTRPNKAGSPSDPTNKMSSPADLPIYFQPLPDVYEKHYETIQDQSHHYEKLAT